MESSRTQTASKGLSSSSSLVEKLVDVCAVAATAAMPATELAPTAMKSYGEIVYPIDGSDLFIDRWRHLSSAEVTARKNTVVSHRESSALS